MAMPLLNRRSFGHDRDFWSVLTSQEQCTLRSRASAAAYTRGTVLLSEGSPACQVSIIRTGWAAAMTVKAGRRIPLRMYRPGELIGIGGVLTGAVSTESVTVISDELHVMGLPADSFTHFIRCARSASAALVRIQQARLEEADRLRTIRDYPTTPQRLAGLLVELCRPENSPIPRDDGMVMVPATGMSQAELGSWVGVSRKSVVRALATLRDAGLIGPLLPRFITVTDVGRLRRFVEATDAGSLDSCPYAQQNSDVPT